MRFGAAFFWALFWAIGFARAAESVRTVEVPALPEALSAAAPAAAGPLAGVSAEATAVLPAAAAPSAAATPAIESDQSRPAAARPSPEEARRLWLTRRFQQLDAAFRRQPDDSAHADVAPPVVVAGMAKTFDKMSENLDDAWMAAAFLRHGPAQEAVIEGVKEPADYYESMAAVYGALRAGYAVDIPGRERVRVARVWQAVLSSFLQDLEHDPRVPAVVRDMAARTREGYLDNGALLAAFAWHRQQKARVADARRRFGSELASAAGAAEASKALAQQPWQPPGADERRPQSPPEGVKQKISDMPAMTRDFGQAVARFEAARDRWTASQRASLSPRLLAAEQVRFQDQARVFAEALERHEYLVDYAIEAGLMTTFADNRRLSPAPATKGLRFSRQDDAYRVDAVFETRIAEPAVLDAVRRSIESYWTGDFEEQGRRQRFETRVSIRVLTPAEPYSEDALVLEDGGATSSADSARGVIFLERSFPLSMPAHEFGHLLGLGEGYVNEYDPEEMVFRQRKDRADLMASEEGVVLPRHFAQVVRKHAPGY